MGFTIYNALRWWSRECPDRTALSVDDQPLSYRELYDWSGRVADYLQAQGVRPGDRVCAVAPNSLDYAVLAFGILRAGGIGAPLSFRSTAAEIRDAIADLMPTLVFADRDRQATVAESLGAAASRRQRPMELVAGLRSGAPPAINYQPDEDQPAFIIGTSGSTARPKGVIYSHRTLMTYASEFAISEPRCGRGSSVLSVGPFSSSSGYVLLMRFTALGATLFIESQFSPERALRLLVQHRITTFQSVPIFFERIAAQPGFAAADLSALYWAQVGGARVAPALLQAWRDKGVVLRHVDGSTEAGGGWGARDDVAISQPDKCGRGGMFTEYAILGSDGGHAPPGTAGEILVRSACLTPGYWNNLEATREAIRDGWLRTGDLGMVDEAGNLTFIDRLKDIIISGGLHSSAAEVERVISEVDGVQEVAVVATADASFGETPLAIVHGDRERLSVPKIIAHCDRQPSNYKVPRYVAIEDKPLPRLPSGKNAKPALRLKYQDADRILPKVR
jgi:fatty-acyl-CoA synthase